tara:strand:- start:52519 stop:53103 length:585 start_codon:yes stop_codon:yes gene_type:complete
MSRILNRCKWCVNDEEYIQYHDKEWGVPINDDRIIFECLSLEIFQSGLSWITILKKRENFRKSFDNFNYTKISKYSEKKIEKLLSNKNIIRNKNKIYAVKKNALFFIKIIEEFGSFSKYIWEYTNYKTIHNSILIEKEIPISNQISLILSQDLKSRGFQYIGSKTIYALMQSIGMVNDHVASCFRYEEIKKGIK